MTALHPETKRRRLERAGYAPLPQEWLPAAAVERVKRQIEAHRADVERILAEPPKPRGRPPKS